MKYREQGATRSGSASRFLESMATPLRIAFEFAGKTLITAELEVRKLRHDPSELLTRAIQPALWLLIFGQVFARTRAVPTGGLPYIDFLAPGILAQSILFIAIFHGIAIIWERDLGLVHKLLATPSPRAALVLGKGVSAGIRALSQVAFVYALALLLGVQIDWNPLALAAVMCTAILGAACFSTLSLIIACIVKTRERFMGIGQVLTMPLFFASNAIYPISIMPGWLRIVSRFNPLTYEVDALRTLMLAGGTSVFGIAADIGILAAVTAFLVAAAGWIYPKIVT